MRLQHDDTPAVKQVINRIVPSWKSILRYLPLSLLLFVAGSMIFVPSTPGWKRWRVGKKA